MILFPRLQLKPEEMKHCHQSVSKARLGSAILLAYNDLFGRQGCVTNGRKRLTSHGLANWFPFYSNKSPALWGWAAGKDLPEDFLWH